jgi:N6-adenosine-specific RNA methylase IME4
MKYQIIYADPPWEYDDKSLNRGGAERHYKTMSLNDICNLPIKNITNNDSTLFMWATWPKLEESFKVIESWGFNYKTAAFVWVKANKRYDPEQIQLFEKEIIDDKGIDDYLGMGRWTRSNTEFVLLSTKGKPKRINCGVRQLIYYPVMEHSKKPPVTRKRITQLVGDLPRIELFARESAPGWDVWGNEVNSTVDIFEDADQGKLFKEGLG